jgi:hypothetical protein
MERRSGSLSAGESGSGCGRPARQSHASGARYGQFVTLATGMETLPRELGQAARAWRAWIFITAAAEAIDRAPPTGGRLVTAGGKICGRHRRACSLRSRPMPSSWPSQRWPPRLLVDGLDRRHSPQTLSGIEYAGSAIVSLGIQSRRMSPIRSMPQASWCRGSRAAASSPSSFSSSKFPGPSPRSTRAPADSFVGGRTRSQSPPTLHDEPLTALVRRELAARDRRPRHACSSCRSTAGMRAMPQYHLGHVDRDRRDQAAGSQASRGSDGRRRRIRGRRHSAGDRLKPQRRRCSRSPAPRPLRLLLLAAGSRALQRQPRHRRLPLPSSSFSSSPS